MRLPFKSVRSGVRVNLDPNERAILVQLLGQLDELLDDGVEASEDPLAAMIGISGNDFGADLDFSELDDATQSRPDPGPSNPPMGDPALGNPAPSGPVPSHPGPSHPGPSDRGPSDRGPSDPGLSDPALARLLPDGNRDDPEASAEFRRLTEFGLRARKRSGARLAAEALGREAPVVLAADESLALMKAITDVRLVLGERLELRTDDDAERLHERLWKSEGTESWLATASIYEVLTSWQEYLIAAVIRKK